MRINDWSSYVCSSDLHVFMAAARVGGIHANSVCPSDFIRDNLLIQTHIIDNAGKTGVERLMFLGSSCVYPKLAPQPIKEEYLLTGPLEGTNRRSEEHTSELQSLMRISYAVFCLT